MASYFSVIQYISNPVADERVNIGLIVFDDDGGCMVRPLESWTRAERFTGQRGRNLRRHVEAVADYIETASSPSSAIESAVAEWTHSVQLTPSRASLRSLEEVLASGVDQILVEERATISRRTARPELGRAALGSMTRALDRVQLGEISTTALEGRKKIDGAVEAHDVDLSMRNGKLLVAVRVLAFPARPSTYTNLEVSDAAWTVQDLRASESRPQVTVLVGPPSDLDRPDYQRAQRVLGELDTDIVEPDRLESWASETVARHRGALEGLVSA